MKLRSIDPRPFHRLRYQCAKRGGGTESRLLPFQRGRVDALPGGLSALVVTADLQGVVNDEHREPRPLGVAVAEALEGLLGLSSASLGVIVAGDLYCVASADERGGFGDVSEVWTAFASVARWVVGVAGNHDDVSRLPRLANQHLLDTVVLELEGLRVGGVGLASGNPRRRGKRAPNEHLEHVELIASERPDVLVLHEGPAGGTAQPGNADLTERLEAHSGLVICGHVPWANAFDGVRPWLNVCERVVVLTA